MSLSIDDKSSKEQNHWFFLIGVINKSFPTYDEIFPPSDSLSTNIFAGLISGIKVILGSIVFASLIFESEGSEVLSENIGVGINVILLSAALGMLINSTFSRMPV